jgi:hypothetical protein
MEGYLLYAIYKIPGINLNYKNGIAQETGIDYFVPPILI